MRVRILREAHGLRQLWQALRPQYNGLEVPALRLEGPLLRLDNKEKKMTKLYCSYETESHQVRPPDPEDSWDNGDYTGDYWVTGVHLTGGMRDAYESEEEVEVGDTVHVVYVAYDTSSTFGTDGGYGEVIAVTKDAVKAIAAESWTQAEIEAFSYNRKRNTLEWPEGLPKPTFLSCTGYFEHNQRVRLQSFLVRP